MEKLYIVSSPQGSSRMMGLDRAKLKYEGFCQSKWTKSCDGQEVKIYEVKLLDSFVIEGTEPEIGFW